MKTPTHILSTASPKDSLQFMGGKAGNLHHLSSNQIPVPSWFCVSSEMCRHYLSAVSNDIADTLSKVDYSNQDQVDKASDTIKHLICGLELSDADQKTLNDATRELGAERLAVRSSALAEDSAKDSFAGQLDTYLYVTPEDVIAKLKECWASGFGPRSLTYMANRGMDPTQSLVAVVVQSMVDSVVSGVMFMANPTGSLDESVIVAGYGLGEGIVSDQVESDMYVFDRSADAWHTLLNDKLTRVVRNPETGAGTIIEEVPEKDQQEPALTEEQRASLFNLGTRISDIYDHYQDIEWALDPQGGLCITQSRPITTIPKGQMAVFDNSNVVESYPGITKPLTFSHILTGYEILFRNATIRLGIPREIVFQRHQVFKNLLGYVHGRVYYNLTNWYRMFALVPATQSYLPVWEEMLGIGQGLRDAKQAKMPLSTTIKCFGNIFRYFVFLSQHSDKIEGDFKTLHKRVRNLDFDTLTNHELSSLYRDAFSSMMYGWEITLLNDGYAFGFSGLVRACLKKLGLEENVFGGLMAGEEDLESVQPVRSIVSIAELARNDQALRDWVDAQLESDAIALNYDSFPDTPQSKKMRQLIERHLDLFGDRCLEELKLEAVPFRDEPKKLLALVQTYSSSDVKVDEMVAKEHAIRDQATVVVNKALRFKPLYSLWFRWALAMARRSVRYRESSRLDRARSFGIVRSLFRQMGKNFAEEGAIEDSEDIFYLTVEEVLGFVAGSSVNKSLRWLIDERKKTESTYEATQPADRIRTQGTTYLNTVPPRYPAHLRVPAMDGSLEGVGCSAGVVTAEAVVVNDPKTVKNIEGKILIAQMTDPGWVFLMISAAGLVVEKGSLLSHTAIIGRELGVPTVVGLPSATVRIKTGDIIKVNGQTGIVEMVKPANSEDA